MENSMVDVFDIEEQKHMGKFHISALDKKYDEWRAKGYGVLLDGSGDICVDTGEPEDDGLYYPEQLKELEKWKSNKT